MIRLKQWSFTHCHPHHRCCCGLKWIGTILLLPSVDKTISHHTMTSSAEWLSQLHVPKASGLLPLFFPAAFFPPLPLVYLSFSLNNRVSSPTTRPFNSIWSVFSISLFAQASHAFAHSPTHNRFVLACMYRFITASLCTYHKEKKGNEGKIGVSFSSTDPTAISQKVNNDDARKSILLPVGSDAERFLPFRET